MSNEFMLILCKQFPFLPKNPPVHPLMAGLAKCVVLCAVKWKGKCTDLVEKHQMGQHEQAKAHSVGLH